MYEVKKCFFKERVEAEKVIDRIDYICETYGCVTVADFYDAVGYKEGDYTGTTYGWVSTKEFGVYKDNVTRMYTITHPNPILLDADAISRTAETTLKFDMVNHPPHYQSETGLEVIEVIEAFTSDLRGIEATDTGNVIKYICRWKGKNGLQDLEKAKWYLEHLINHIKKENDQS